MSINAFAVCYTIQNDLLSFSNKLMNFPECKVQIHKLVVVIFNSHPKSKYHVLSVSDVLTALLACLKTTVLVEVNKSTKL